MPIYEYQCQSCHHIFELFQSFDAPTTASCERCSSEAKRLISRPAILFKGSGFHVTDYSRSRNGTATSSNGKEKSSESEKPAESSSTPSSQSVSKG
jgi:putative FmdB family regulatory protein